MVFMGTGGRLNIFRYGYRFIPAEKGAPEITAPTTPDLHVANWLEMHAQPQAGELRRSGRALFGHGLPHL